MSEFTAWLLMMTCFCMMVASWFVTVTSALRRIERMMEHIAKNLED